MLKHITTGRERAIHSVVVLILQLLQLCCKKKKKITSDFLFFFSLKTKFQVSWGCYRRQFIKIQNEVYSNKNRQREVFSIFIFKGRNASASSVEPPLFILFLLLLLLSALGVFAGSHALHNSNKSIINILKFEPNGHKRIKSTVKKKERCKTNCSH